MLVIDCAVLLPVYATASTDSGTWSSLSISNLVFHDGRLFVPAWLLWGNTFWVYVWAVQVLDVVQHLKWEAQWRIKWWGYFVVLLRDIPPEYGTLEALCAELSDAFPGQVTHVQPIKDLDPQVRKQEERYKKSWIAMKRAQRDPVQPSMVSGWCQEEEEAVQYYAKECHEARQYIEQSRDLYVRDVSIHNTAFVTFRSMQAAASANKVLANRWPDSCMRWPEIDGLIHHGFADCGQDPREIEWRHLEKTRTTTEKLFRLSVFCALVAIFIVLWDFPLLLCDLLSDLGALGITWISEPLLSFIQGFVPVLLVTILNLLVPIILHFFLSMAGFEHAQSVERFLMWSYFWFLMIDFFLLRCFERSLLFRNNSVDALNLVGYEVPEQSSYFALYLAGFCLRTPAVKLAFPAGLYMGTIRELFTDFRYKWEEEEAYDSGPPAYGVSMALDGYIFCLCVTFAYVNPIILSFGVLYFFCNAFAYKYLLCSVFPSRFQTEGATVVQGVRVALMGLLVGQMLLLAIFACKESEAAYVVGPLVFVTLIFQMLITGPKSKVLRRKGPWPEWAEELDKTAFNSGLQAQVKAKDGCWLQPALTMNFDQPVPSSLTWTDNGQPWHEVDDDPYESLISDSEFQRRANMSQGKAG